MHSEGQATVSATSGKQENILRRVANMPLVSSTYDIAVTAYNSTKNNHPFVKSIGDAAEKGVKTVTEAAFNSAQPILTKLERQIAIASEYANKSLDTLEEKLPVLQMMADEVAFNSKEMMSAKMASAKDSIASTLSKVVSLTKETVQGSLAVTKSVVNYSLTIVETTRMGRMAVGGAEALLLLSEELATYIPISDEELTALAGSFKDEDMPSEEEEDEDMISEEEVFFLHQPEQQGFLMRLGSLSSKVHNRVYYHSLAKMKLARRIIKNSLLKLQRIIYLLTPKALEQEDKKRYILMLVEPSKIIPKVDKNEQVETQTLTTFHSMIQQLQTACQSLMSRIEGFSSRLQDKVWQVHRSIRELHTTFSTIQVIQILSILLAQNRQKILTVHEYIDDLVEYIAFNTPLSWLVGPFVFRYWPFVEDLEPAENNAEEE